MVLGCAIRPVDNVAFLAESPGVEDVSSASLTVLDATVTELVVHTDVLFVVENEDESVGSTKTETVVGMNEDRYCEGSRAIEFDVETDEVEDSLVMLK